MNKGSTDATTLIFKNIPKQIEDLTTLLNSLQIPAKHIKPFGRKRALISYELKSEADAAIDKLKELEFDGKTPNVSLFCKEKRVEDITKKVNKTTAVKSNKYVQTIKKHNEAAAFSTPQISKYVQKLYAIDVDLNFNQPPPPYLKYIYPPINNDILDNICISLLSNKRFYNQVLHLMNRMNLEPPFAERKHKFKPPGKPKEMATQTDEVLIQVCPLPQVVEEQEEIIESELESSEDDATQKQPQLQIKRKLPSNEQQYKKKARKMLLTVQKLNKEVVKKSSQPVQLAEMFETSSFYRAHTAKIALQLNTGKTPSTINIPSTTKIEKPPLIELPKDLKTQKLSFDDLQKLPIYKNYQIGLASNKLYIKNLHKDVTQEDLAVLYQRFLKDDTMNLDIKVMQHGRMKGQAFVTFQGPLMDEIKPLIAQALEDTNGFILRDKPMVVCYGKQLGLTDTIYVDGGQPQNNDSSRKTSKSKLSQQSYEYVIAVDFEATCWENQAPPRWRESEIIEFPAVLVNLKTGKIEAEFHKYIMPIESPKLSAYCTELTGITQKTVDMGIPLQTALMMFQEWLRKELRARHLSLPKMSKDNKIGNCAFVTWTDWDFGICLNKECTRKRLKKAPYFNQWIDMRAIYREWYNYRPINFLDALSHVGLHFEGKQHSGIDDAKNLANLTYKLVTDGATLAITKDLTPFQLNLNCVF